jgi:hypothetical protein
MDKRCHQPKSARRPFGRRAGGRRKKSAVGTAPATAAERFATEVAAHLLELLPLLFGQDVEDIGLGQPDRNPELGLNFVLRCCMFSERTLIEDCRVVVCRAVGLPLCLKLLDVSFFVDLDARCVDDGLNLVELLIAQAELIGHARQHALEEAQSVATLTVVEPTLTASVWCAAASPSAAGSVSRSGLGKDHRRCGEENGRCKNQDDVSCFHVCLRVLPLSGVLSREV